MIKFVQKNEGYVPQFGQYHGYVMAVLLLLNELIGIYSKASAERDNLQKSSPFD